MTLAEIIARTAAERAAGLNPVYRHGKTPAAVTAARPAAATLPVIAPCLDLGARVPGEPCGSPLLRCNRHGDVTTRFTACDGAARCCASCPDKRTAVPAPAAVERPAEPATVGVVIGSYKWPQLADLQVRAIRETCGSVPILISNDHPPSQPALLALCKAHPGVAVAGNKERIGHTGGDLAAYWRAAMWGRATGLKVVAKLSQRFIFTRPRWLQDGAADLLASGLPLAIRGCVGSPGFPLRTEAALIDVAAWGRPAVLARVEPAPRWHTREGGLSAEVAMAELLRDEFGGVYWPWALIPERRPDRGEGFVWHNSHTIEEYRALAARHGVTLPAEFTCDGWEAELKRGEYKFG
jgi:hypothetical protein